MTKKEFKEKIGDWRVHPTGFTFELIGEEGSGKTSITYYALDEIGKRAIEELDCGNKDHDRILVVSEGLKDVVIVAVRQQSLKYNEKDLFTIINKALSNYIFDNKGYKIGQSDITNEYVDKEIKRIFKGNEKIQKVYLEHKDSLLKLFNDMLEKSKHVYAYVKKRCIDNKIQNDNAAFVEAIENQVELCWNDIEIRELDKVLRDAIQKQISELFLVDDVTKDGYNIFFLGKDSDFQKLREVTYYFDEIILYSPINSELRTKLNEKREDGKNVPTDKDGQLSFVILERKGLSHFDIDNTNEIIFEEQLYDSRLDAIVIVRNIGTQNINIKLDTIYCQGLKKFNRSNPIIIVNSKFDKAALEIADANYNKNNLGENKEEYYKSLNGKVLESVEKYCDGVKKTRAESKGKKGSINYCGCISKKSELIESGYYESEYSKGFGLSDLYEKIFEDVSDFMSSKNSKIPVCLNKENNTFSFDEDKAKEVVMKIVSEENAKKVFSQCIENIYENMIIPNGNGFKALERRLANGEGYTSIIDKSHYWYCDSFEIKYPNYLMGLITDDVIMEMWTAFTKTGWEFEDVENGQKLFLDRLKYHIRKKDFVKVIMYDNAFLDAKKCSNGFSTCYKAFLGNSHKYFTQIDEPSVIQIYVEAMIAMMEKAVLRTMYFETIFVNTKEDPAHE